MIIINSSRDNYQERGPNSSPGPYLDLIRGGKLEQSDSLEIESTEHAFKLIENLLVGKVNELPPAF